MGQISIIFQLVIFYVLEFFQHDKWSGLPSLKFLIGNKLHNFTLNDILHLLHYSSFYTSIHKKKWCAFLHKATLL